jgi:kinesin family protein 5
LKLRKNNWDSDTYEFDELLTEFASQKRVYEVVAKPVVEVPTNEFKSVIYVEDLYLGLLIQMSLTGPGGGLLSQNITIIITS